MSKPSCSIRRRPCPPSAGSAKVSFEDAICRYGALVRCVRHFSGPYASEGAGGRHQSMNGVSNAEVKAFWEDNPVAAEGIAAEPGTPRVLPHLRCVARGRRLRAVGLFQPDTRILRFGGPGGPRRRLRQWLCAKAVCALRRLGGRRRSHPDGYRSMQGAFRTGRIDRRFSSSPMGSAFHSTMRASISPVRWACCITSNIRGRWSRRCTACSSPAAASS